MVNQLDSLKEQDLLLDELMECHSDLLLDELLDCKLSTHDQNSHRGRNNARLPDKIAGRKR